MRAGLRWLIPALVATYTLTYFLLPFATSVYPGAFADDFFYYLLAAKHIVAGQGSTFDGAHATNGYHPLWMVVCIAMTAVFHSGHALFLAFALLSSALVLCSYILSASILERYTTPFAAQSIAGAIAVNFADIAGGMEVTLSVPLLLLFCWYRITQFKWRAGQAFIYGLLLAATVLSRLDCALFVLLIAPLDLFLSSDVPRSDRLRAIGPFVLGMSPVLAYLAFNSLTFGTAMPISSHAKQLRFHHSFSQLPLRSLKHFPFPEVSTLIRPVFAASLLSLFLLFLMGPGRLPNGQRGLVYALLLFAPLQLTVLSFSSDWQLWPWYLHPLLVCSLACAIVLLTREEGFFVRRYPLTGILALALFGYMAVQNFKGDLSRRADPHFWRYSILLASRDLASFAAAHPGVYAMGDRAGTFAYYAQDPVVQTEGLMMDKAFLENIREQRNLVQVLRAYSVRYFIATNPSKAGSCLLAREPAQGGPDSRAMEGLFCSKPLHFYRSVDGYSNVVFDLDQEAGSESRKGT